MFYWIPSDRQPRFQQALEMMAEAYSGICGVYAVDMLIAIGKNHSFLSDSRFECSFKSTVEQEHESSLIWRLHVLVWAASHALHVPGDFVECGVARGFSSAVLCKYLDFASVAKSFYLYDTFAGLPPETSTEAERESWNRLYVGPGSEKLLAKVRETFAPYPNVQIVPGIVPKSFEEKCPQKIAYLHIDMNSVQAEKLALEHLFDRVSPSGLIVLDDFGWVCNREQMRMHSAFMAERDYRILELPTGQGLVIKR